MDIAKVAETVQNYAWSWVFTIPEDGDVQRVADVFGPTVTNDPDGDVTVDGEGWECLTGMTGQYGYRGAMMHTSEFVGTGIAERLVEMSADAREDGKSAQFSVVTVDDDETGAPVGWAIAYRTVPLACADVATYRGRLEKARDKRAGNLHDPETMGAFEARLREFLDVRDAHRAATGCTESH